MKYYMKKIIAYIMSIVIIIPIIVGTMPLGVFATVEILMTDKTEYTEGENIVVTAAGGGEKAWVGLYKKGEIPGSGTASIYWYYVNGSADNSLANKPVILQNQSSNNRKLDEGIYELHLFGDNGYNSILKTVEITIISRDGGDSSTDGNLISLDYKLDNINDGLANGSVTIKASSESISGADCVMYWADDAGKPLEGYTSLAKFRLTGTTTIHNMYDYTIIPEGAETLIAYKSVSGKLSGDPVITELPEGCNYLLSNDYNAEFQLISDIHIRSEENHIHNTHFKQFLEDVSKNSPDSIGIFINGDITDNGQKAQYDKLVSLYNNSNSSGNLPMLHLAIGNHDWMSNNPENQFQKYTKLLNTNLKEQPENVYYHEVVDGYDFIYLGGERGGTSANLSDNQLTWFDDLMKSISAKDSEKPVFVLLHQPLYDTVAGTLKGQGWHGVSNEQKLRDVLKKYDQIIIAGGHSHWELDSERNMYPGDDNMSVAVNTASVGYLWTSYNVIGGEHANGSNGYYVRVYDDKVVFLGRDIEHSRWVSSAMFVVEKNHIYTSNELYEVNVNEDAVKMDVKFADDNNIRFESSDESIVKVSSLGELQPVSEGSASIKITANATDKYVKNYKTVDVRVINEPIVHEHKWDNGVVTKPTKEEQGYITYTCIECGESKKDDYTDKLKVDIKRIYGATRYETSFELADALKERLGVNKFSTVIITSGENFADALAGSYLAAKKNAPIILTNGKNINDVHSYIKNNLQSNGTVYILGGVNAVSENMKSGLEDYKVIRLDGATRFETNLAILDEAGVSNEEILICTGNGFADSLSASATGKPVLLVDKNLTEEQKTFLKKYSNNKYYILGGTTAVRTLTEIQIDLCVMGAPERIGGETRYETSVLIAEKLYDTADSVVLAYAMNYPDGLSGGPLAVNMKAPLILTNTDKEEAAKNYVSSREIISGVVIGGPGLIADKSLDYIFK